MQIKITSRLSFDGSQSKNNVRVFKNFTFILLKVFRINQKRRAVSEIISTLLLLAITIVGAVLAFGLFQGSQITTTIGTINSQVTTKPVILTGYDTRDGSGLSGITGFNNVIETPSTLCASSCVALHPNAFPAAGTGGGSEFIIINLRNTGSNTVILSSIYVNNTLHTWDNTLSTSSAISSSNFPKDGKFTIIGPTNPSTTPSSTNQLVAGQEVRVVIKLSGTVSNIPITGVIPVAISVGGATNPATFIIPAGTAR